MWKIFTLPLVSTAIGVAGGVFVVFACREVGVTLSLFQEKVAFFGFAGLGLMMGLGDLVGWLIHRRKPIPKPPVPRDEKNTDKGSGSE
jgi:hypothetical protein